MKKFFKNREEARKFRRELVVPLLVEAGIFCIESFIADALIPGYVSVNREKLQTRRGKATFIAGAVASYPALLGFNLMATEKLSKPINDILDDIELDREAKKIARLYVKGFTAEEIANALDMDKAEGAFPSVSTLVVMIPHTGRHDTNVWYCEYQTLVRVWY